jgi:hypothetical protein
MDETKTRITRRGALACAVGGATIVTAIAQTKPKAGAADPLLAFRNAFRSPFFSLERGDHTAWRMEVGTTLRTSGGALLRVSGVETFADYGRQARNLIRSRAFLVNFELVGGRPLTADAIHTLTHPRYGRLDLFLKTTPGLPRFVQAVFN